MAIPSPVRATNDCHRTLGPSPTTAALHQYACVRCRTRKIKCDHLLAGCATCKAAGAQCIYLSRRTRKKRATVSILPLLPTVKVDEAVKSVSGARFPHEDRAVYQDSHDTDEGDLILPCEVHDLTFESKFDSSCGRLFVSHGRSRFINSRKADEVAKLEKIIVEEHRLSPETKDSRSPHTSHTQSSRLASHDFAGLLLSTNLSTKQDLRACQPPAEVMGRLWDYYVSNVDKAVKILYKPASSALIKQAQRDSNLSMSNNAFLFAIWLASITAMSDGDCLQLMDEPRVTLLHRYRQCLVQALTEAAWITTQETVVLQAIVLSLACSSWKNTRSTWMLSGITVSIAQAMGMHHDSTSFALNIIDTEIRRRLWWTICLFDKRISDDCGLDTHLPMTMNTKLPLHVNDSDLEATGGKGALVPRDEFTEMTMSMVKIEIAQTNLKIGQLQHQQSPFDFVELETLVREQVSRYESIYLKYFDHSIQLHRLCYLGIRLIIAKLWKLAYDEYRRSGAASGREDIEDMFLLYNSQVLEFAHQLPDRSTPYGWSFRCKYSQWHAMAYLLIELCHRTHGPVVERAWRVLDAVFGISDQVDTPNSIFLADKSTRRNTAYQALRNLYQRAQLYRLENSHVHNQQQANESHHNKITSASSSYGELPSLTNRDGSNMDYSGAILNDPFSDPETGSFNIEDFTWEGLDSLVQLFQQDNLDFGGYQSITGMEPLSLW